MRSSIVFWPISSCDGGRRLSVHLAAAWWTRENSYSLSNMKLIISGVEEVSFADDASWTGRKLPWRNAVALWSPNFEHHRSSWLRLFDNWYSGITTRSYPRGPNFSSYLIGTPEAQRWLLRFTLRLDSALSIIVQVLLYFTFPPSAKQAWVDFTIVHVTLASPIGPTRTGYTVVCGIL